MNLIMHTPPHPGEVLAELYLRPLDITIGDFANRIKVSRNTVSKIINGHRAVSPDMALRFSQALGDSPDSWLGMQQNTI